MEQLGGVNRASEWRPRMFGGGIGTRTRKGFYTRLFSRQVPHPAGFPPYLAEDGVPDTHSLAATIRLASGAESHSVHLPYGWHGGARTHDSRFNRAVLYQLSYMPPGERDGWGVPQLVATQVCAKGHTLNTTLDVPILAPATGFEPVVSTVTRWCLRPLGYTSVQSLEPTVRIELTSLTYKESASPQCLAGTDC